MSDTTRTHRPTTASPRYTKRHGIGRDRLRWASRTLGTFRKDMTDADREAITRRVAGLPATAADIGKYEETTDGDQ